MKKFLFLILFAAFSLSYPQEKNDIFNTVLNDTEIFFLDGYNYFTYPLSLNSNDLIYTGIIGGSIYSLIHTDKYIRKSIGSEVNQYNTKFWKVFEAYGVVQYAEIAGASIYAAGLFSEDEEIRILGRMLVQSLTYSGLTAMVIRMIAGRKRPPFTNDPFNFIGFTTDNSFQSFPSGHVTVAFAFSTVLAEYINTPLSRIGFYGLAGLAATERLINNQHWFSDVVLGALVGIAGAAHVINENDKRKSSNNRSSNSITIIPGFDRITLKYSLN